MFMREIVFTEEEKATLKCLLDTEYNCKGCMFDDSPNDTCLAPSDTDGWDNYRKNISKKLTEMNLI